MKRLAAILAALTLTATGCGAADLTSATLPGGVANGDDGYEIVATFATVSNLVANSEVMYHEVRVGTVRSISLNRRTWEARVVLRIKNSVQLPAGVKANVAQKSLLGAEFVELVDPEKSGSPARLAAGGVIPASSTNRYPEVDELLAAVSLLLNNGGLAQIRTITSELSQALHGRTGDVRSVLKRLDRFLGTLADQRVAIADTVESINQLSAELADDGKTVDEALTTITPAVRRLRNERPEIVDGLDALDRFAAVGTRVVKESRSDLKANLHSLRPLLSQLVAAGQALPDSLPLALSFPFPVTTLERAGPGDYLNAFLTFDFTSATLQHDLLGQGAAASAEASTSAGNGPAAASPTPTATPDGVSLPGVSLPGISLPGVSVPGVSVPGVLLPGMPKPQPTASSDCGVLALALGGCS